MPAHKNGFSLIESAIVLAVVGLVIGGIWVAAATVQRNMKYNMAIDTIAQVALKSVNLLNSRVMPPAYTYIDPVALFGDAIPPQMISASGNFSLPFKLIYDTEAIISVYIVSNFNPAYVHFYIEMDRDTCLTLAPRLAGRLKVSVYNDDDNSNVSTPALAAQNCIGPEQTESIAFTIR